MIDNNDKNYKSALTIALRFLNHKDRTEYEIHERLIRDEFAEEVIASVIDYLKEQGYLNDRRYAGYYYVCYAAKRSIRRIRTELSAKGIDRDLLDNIEESMGYLKKEQTEAVERALEKQLIKRKINDINNVSYDEKSIIKAALYRQGFSAEAISEVFDV